jgi:hypothetical protein
MPWSGGHAIYRDAISLRHGPVTLHYVPSVARAIDELDERCPAVGMAGLGRRTTARREARDLG